METKFKDTINFEKRIIGKINNIDLLSFNIAIPNEQRIKDNIKIDEIVKYQEEYNRTNNRFNFLGVINIHECENDYYLVDGQHRFNAIKCLTNKGYRLIDVAIELVKVNNLEDLKGNYTLINKNTELPEFPDTIDKNIPEEASMYFFEKYPNIWSSSNTKRVRRPHLNKNNFQESLGVLTEKLKLTSTIELQNIIEEYNSKLSNWPISNFPNYKSFKDPSKIHNKCISTKIFLGLFVHKSDDYGYDWVKQIIKSRTGEDIKSVKKKSRSKVPHKIRKESWHKYIGKNIGATDCICCNTTEITAFNFEAGHIIPSSKGGLTTLENILPICSECNRSMGNTNMGDYIKQYYPNSVINFNMRIYKDSILAVNGYFV